MKRRGFLALLPALPAGFKAAVLAVMEAQVPVELEIWGINVVHDVHVNALLTRISLAYINEAETFPTGKVFPDEA